MIQGSIVAIVTPFTSENEIDQDALRSLVRWHLEEGTDAIVCCGTTGEAPTLSHEEELLVFKIVVEEVSGKIPVIAGTGCYDTKTTLQKTISAKKCGADAALVVVPYYNRPMPQGCIQHFQEVAKADFPMILYHHPARTGVKLPTWAIKEICDIPQVIGVKEATGDVDFAIEVMQMISKPLYSGDDLLALPLIASGAKGDISIIANIIPGLWKKFICAVLLKDLSVARELQRKIHPLCKALVIETNPQGVKYALGLMGKCSSSLRLPMILPQAKTQEKIKESLIQFGLIESSTIVF